MKNNHVVLSILLAFYIGTILITTTSCQKLKYPIGRDTYDFFGNGTFQILNPPSPLESYALINNSTGETIESNIIKYKKKSSNIFLIGEENGYTVLNYESGRVIQNKNLNKFSQNEQNIFNEGHRFKLLEKGGTEKGRNITIMRAM